MGRPRLWAKRTWRFQGKHTCRAIFTEYRANATFGHDANGNMQPDRFGNGQGIIPHFATDPSSSSDPRWFSRTEKKVMMRPKPQLGKQQWQWFKSLLASKATFKCITGMIWDDKKTARKMTGALPL